MKGKNLKWLSLILVLVVCYAALNVVQAPVTLPKVYMNPEENICDTNGSFTVEIHIADVTDLYAWGIRINWERYLLEIHEVTQGPFLYGPEGTEFAQEISDDYINIGCTILGDYNGLSGSGILMYVTFNVTDAGKTLLDFYVDEVNPDCVLLDHNLDPMAHTAEDGYFETPQAANLVKKSAWPEHHHFDISVQLAKDGDSNQTLYSLVKNIGPAGYDLYVYVAFEIVRDDGVVATPTSDVVTVAPGATADLSADFGPLDSLDVGKHYVSATCWYSYTGTYWAQGEKIKTFSFAVVS